jgi:hypothetical protein
MSLLDAVPADGITARWQTWDGEHDETLTLRWENEGWTATGEVGREKVHYALRLSAIWQVRQFLLFRDLDEPDLWLATDGHRRWGEMNGAHRTDLDGCVDIELICTPFTATPPIRRLELGIGDSIEVRRALVDVETLAVTPVHRRYTRTAQYRFEIHETETGESTPIEVDRYGLITESPGRFRRR